MRYSRLGTLRHQEAMYREVLARLAVGSRIHGRGAGVLTDESEGWRQILSNAFCH